MQGRSTRARARARARAERAARAAPDSLRRIHEATEHARRRYLRSAQTQQIKDAIEIPGLSKAALDVLRDVRTARGMAEVQRDGKGYDERQRQRRREEAVAGAWQKGRADPRVAGELDRFFATASQWLGEKGERAASRAASSGRRMELPGIGREHQAGLDELARHFVQVREGVTFNAQWEHRVEQQARRPRGGRPGRRSGSAGDCRESWSRTARGNGRRAGCGWGGNKASAVVNSMHFMDNTALMEDRFV